MDTSCKPSRTLLDFFLILSHNGYKDISYVYLCICVNEPIRSLIDDVTERLDISITSDIFLQSPSLSQQMTLNSLGNMDNDTSIGMDLY